MNTLNPNAYQVEKLIAYDIEVYPNYFLAGFMDALGNVWQFTEVQGLLGFLSLASHTGFDIVGFNSAGYDDPVTSEWIEHSGNKELHAYHKSCDIISGKLKPWDVKNQIRSIDIMPLLPGQMSLKQIGVRLGHDRLQELPIDPHNHLTEHDKVVIKDYNINDLQITWKLIHELKGELELRSSMSREYGIDLRSKGDAQIAEAVITSEISKISTLDTREMKYLAKKNKAEGTITVPLPSWWEHFDVLAHPTSNLRYILDNQYPRFRTPIPLDEYGRLLKGGLDSTVYLDDTYYQTGVGGLHSMDGSGCHKADDDYFLVDIDVTSYYPYICLTQGAFPRHLDEYFGKVYERIVDRRIAAKKAGDMVTADSLKISINSSFGKSSDPYSALFDPQATATITITGQTALLILIAMLADAGITTVSANTDGLTAKVPRQLEIVLRDKVERWELLTGFNMEYSYYKSTYALDVNNYLAIKEDGIKAKGRFVTPKPGKYDLRHSLNATISAEAVKEYLQHGTMPEVTVRECKDINRFLLTHAVTGEYKCFFGDEHLGKLIRFYKSTLPGLPRIGKWKPGMSGMDRVPNSENCIPAMDLPGTFPDDIDYDWYIEKAEEWLKSITREKAVGNNQFAYNLSRLGYSPAMVPADPKARRIRAFVEEGSVDFNSMPPGMTMGISTGKKAETIAAIDTVTGYPLLVYKTTSPFPPSTRKKIEKEFNLKILYGANVMFPRDMLRPLQEIPDILRDGWYRDLYTPAELKKIGVVLDEYAD